MIKKSKTKISTKSADKESNVQEKKKKFKELTPSAPEQLTLFTMLDVVEHRDRQDLSQSIELYDFMPKYVFDSRSLVKPDGSLPPIIREFECRGNKHILAIHPASLINPDTHEVKYSYLGERELILEEVLRKLAVDQNASFLDGEAGTTFSFYKIREELKNHNHALSFQEVRESLEILALSNLELINPEKKKDKVIFSPVENFGISGEDDETRTFVVFSPFVTKSILNTTFRIYNYARLMDYRSVISRQLYKRMSHHYIQASYTNTYEIRASTMVRDFGLTLQSRIRDNLKNIEAALIELKTGYYPSRSEKNSKSQKLIQPIIADYSINKIYNEKKKNKVEDYVITLRPSIQFVQEMIAANTAQKIFQTKHRQTLAEK